jgi:circadian clock protein KaiC
MALAPTPVQTLPKTFTGIEGLDVITGGGLPTGRATLVCGGTGTGKTILAMEFLYRGATQFNEPGVLMTFEENSHDVAQNMLSLGLNVQALVYNKSLVLDYVALNPEEVVEAGSFNLDALFIRLAQAIDSIGAKRVVLDTIDSLFGALPNPARLRSELHRLFQWLKDKGVTAIVTGESGAHTYTRDGLEEYVSDCVILLTTNMENRMASRSLRIIKYRGSYHGSNEYPFVIDEHGVSLIPITAEGLECAASAERVSSGIPKLDDMIKGSGFYRASAILVSGAAGTGKSTFLASFAHAACQRQERALYISFEESASQIVRNMKSAGIHLDGHVQQGLLKIESSRCTQFDLEQHLLKIRRAVTTFDPQVVVIDPITSLADIASHLYIKRMLAKLVAFLKNRNISLMLGSLTPSGAAPEGTSVAISSLIDSWIFLEDIEGDGELNRALVIRKSRGMAHSNKVREFKITDDGIDICDILYGTTGVLTGRPRQMLMAKNKAMLLQTEVDSL